jgi:hypothetical protein
MADMQKKMGAALAAVSAYLQDEEAMAAAQQVGAIPSGPQSQQSLWGQSGRQEMMNMRRLIQMRAFERCR